MIGERPARVEGRGQIGHWEIDTMMGESPGESSHCVLTLVERKSGYLMMGKLPARTAAETNRALLGLRARHPGRMRTITADNGTEFHWYGQGRSSQSGQVLLRHPPITAGSAGPTRTPTGSSGSTFRKVKRWPESPKANAT